MPIYKEMYLKLFQQVSKTIENLQQVQQECEQMYMEANASPPIELAEKPEQGPEEP